MSELEQKSLGKAKILSAKGWTWLIALFVFTAIVIPILNRFVEPGSFFHLSDLTVGTLAKYMCFAIMALAIDLIWGYTGILSLGHAFFFALGAYIMGMHLIKYMNDVLHTVPDFMAYMPWQEFPWFWNGFEHFSYGLLMALLIPALIAFLLGYFTFRSRIKGVYFAILTQALTFGAYSLFLVNETGFGGNNGFTNFKGILGFTLANDAETQKLGLMSDVATTKLGLYIVTASMLCVCFLICRYIVSSKLGRVLTAIRDEEARVSFSGYNTMNFKLFVWTVSAVLCAIGGILFVPQVGIINPSEMHPSKSIEAVVWVALGGRGTLVGAILGAGVVNGTKTLLTTGSLAEYWLFILGGMAVLVTLFFPGGLTDKKSHIKVAQGLGRLIGANTNKYAFSNLVPVLIFSFYFASIALGINLLTASFVWNSYSQFAVLALLALPVYILLNGFYQALTADKRNVFVNMRKLVGDISLVFVKPTAGRFYFGVLIVLGMLTAFDSEKTSSVLALFALFMAPLFLMRKQTKNRVGSIPIALNKILLLSYLVLAIAFVFSPILFLLSAVHIGLIVLLVVAALPFVSVLKNLRKKIKPSTITPVVFLLIVYFFLFFFAANFFQFDSSRGFFLQVNSPDSFFLQIIHAFFDFSDKAFSLAGIKPNLFFALCAAYAAWGYWKFNFKQQS